MSERIPRSARLLMASTIVAICALAMSAGSAMAASEIIYSNVPNNLPGNFSSVGAEAYSYTEIGGQVELAGAARNKPQVEVVMSSWACQYGSWYAETCETPAPTKRFKEALTLKIYEVGEKNLVGEEIGKITKTFAMPYRPSDDVIHCTGGRWYEATKKECFHGLAFRLKFPALKTLRLPKHVILGLSYNTSNHGPHPFGKAECSTKSAGCFYDSLNVALAEPEEELLTVGKDLTEPYIQSTYGELTCNNPALASKFGPTECPSGWGGDQPLFKIAAH